MNILDPQGRFLNKWNKILLIICVVAVSFDPLFFYIPVIDTKKKCLDLDKKLVIACCVLRSFLDMFYVLHIIFQFRTGFIVHSSRVFGRGQLTEDSSAIAIRYMSSYFIVDILSVLPLPQVVLLAMPQTRTPISLIAKDALKFIILGQYGPRFMRLYPLFKEVKRASDIFTGTAWAGATLYLFLYMLASHVVGAFWYLLSVDRVYRCWQDAFEENNFDVRKLYCQKTGVMDTNVNALLNASCPFTQADVNDLEAFDFGIFLDALQSHMLERRHFPKKLLYCFWWGLRGLSSMGQNLQTSTYGGEILFAVFISICGLVLFSLLIGNMQKYLQSSTVSVREEELRIKRRDVEQWMSRRFLPNDLKERIRRHYEYKWQETRGVEEETLISTLPRDLRSDVRHHLCSDLIKRVPIFEKLNMQLLHALCDCLKPGLYIEGSYILREGDPVNEMLFIVRGRLESISTNDGRRGFLDCFQLCEGDFCGEELISWSMAPKSSSGLPISTRTIKAITEVEAFSLIAEDMKEVSSLYRSFLGSEQFRNIFRFYSQQWRTWAACIIQAAWRHFRKRKLEESLWKAEHGDNGGTSTSLVGSFYASKFAVRLRRATQSRPHKTRLPSRMSSASKTT